MPTVSLAQFDESQLDALVQLVGPVDDTALWNSLAKTVIPTTRSQELSVVLGWLRDFDTVTVNESTLWARAIYPLLVLAEEERVRAWSQVPVRATLGGVELAGVVDGVLAREGVVGGQATPPFLLVVETKRGIDATDPRAQLLAAMLASIEAERAHGHPPSAIERFGCFTVGDTWKFLHAVERVIDGTPSRAMSVSWSRAFSERLEAEAILATLRGIVGREIAAEQQARLNATPCA
ncbi:MAG: hypothetical protein U0326_31110 [Polyangiales bacterium]